MPLPADEVFQLRSQATNLEVLAAAASQCRSRRSDPNLQPGGVLVSCLQERSLAQQAERRQRVSANVETYWMQREDNKCHHPRKTAEGHQRLQCQRHGRMREILSAGPANIRGECHCGECPNDYLAQLQIEIAEAVLSQRAQIAVTYIEVICDGCPFWK